MHTLLVLCLIKVPMINSIPSTIQQQLNTGIVKEDCLLQFVFLQIKPVSQSDDVAHN